MNNLARIPTAEFAPEEASAELIKLARVPRITIQACCATPEMAEILERVSADRRMGRAQMHIQTGGISAAVQLFKDAPTPDLIVVESEADGGALIHQLNALADVCDARTKVLVIGYSNDIALYRELLERGVSDYVLAPVDPVSLISRIAGLYPRAASDKFGQVYAFVGAKGGVGSSTVAHNVAWTMARMLSSDVILADLDLPFGTGSLDFNLQPGQGIAEAVFGADRLDELLLDRLLTKCGEHLSLLAAPALLDKTYDLDQGAFEQLVDLMRSNVPFTVLDVPHTWTSWAKTTLVSADEIVITAAPDLANLRNAKALVQLLRQARPNDAPPKLILNQVGVPKRPEIKPADFASALQLEPIATLPFEPKLFGTAANNGQMLAEASKKPVLNRGFSEVARTLTGRVERKRRGGILGGLFRR